MRKFQPHRGPGFTLIELLIVASIIALLVAILIPALSAARNQAHAAVCLSNLKQVSTGIQMFLLEAGMRRQRVSTNYGWAVYAYRNCKEQGKLFTCPADVRPLPVPAVYADVYRGTAIESRVAADAVFNSVRDGKPGWRLDIQDSIDGSSFGRDAGSGDYADHDLLLGHSAGHLDLQTDVNVVDINSSRSFVLMNYKGHILQNPAQAGATRHRLPLLWMSYGANASAGLKGVSGNPLLIIEYYNLGAFPESFAGLGADGKGRANDALGPSIRFRHGSRVADKQYQPPLRVNNYPVRERANTAFLDGHAESLNARQLLIPSQSLAGTDLKTYPTGKPRANLWLGTRSGMKSFD